MIRFRFTLQGLTNDDRILQCCLGLFKDRPASSSTAEEDTCPGKMSIWIELFPFLRRLSFWNVEQKNQKMFPMIGTDGVKRLRREVVLLTDDRNLRVKSLSRDVPVRDLPAFLAWSSSAAAATVAV